MKVIVLGAAGRQAQGVIRDLCSSPEVTEVILADLEKTKDGEIMIPFSSMISSADFVVVAAGLFAVPVVFARSLLPR